MPVLIRTFTPLMQGRPPYLAERWPYTTGLASYLSSYFSITDGRSCFQSALLGRYRMPANLRRLAGCVSPSLHAPLRVPFAKRNLVAKLALLGGSAGYRCLLSQLRPNSLAHSSNCRPFPITVSAFPTKTQLRKPDSARGWFLYRKAAPLSGSRFRPLAA
jgi:hypothetical protein